MGESSGLSAAQVLQFADAGESLNAAERGLLLLEAALPASEADGLSAVGLGTRDASVLALRCGTFGDTLSARVTCPACGQLLASAIAREEVEREPEGGGGEVEVSVGSVVVTARTPDCAALLAAAACADVAAARRSLIESCVVRAMDRDGRELAPLSLSDEVLEAVGEALVEADPQAEVRVELTCASCMHAWAPVFDVVHFFWRELSTTSVQILDDVHQLAIGYGWSEGEVLNLSSRRRRRYVDRLLGA